MKKTSASRGTSLPLGDTRNIQRGLFSFRGDPSYPLCPRVKVEDGSDAAAPAHLPNTVEEDEIWGDIAGHEPPKSERGGCVVDLTEEFNSIFVRTTFDSFMEFEELFNTFKEETGSVFRIKSSCSIEYENSRRKRHFIPSRFKFVTARYCCVHFGKPKMSGQGIRTMQRYLPCGCEAMLSLSYNRGALVISNVNMRHNHEVSSDMAPFYSINRRISNAELRAVAGAVETIPDSKSLRNFLQIHFQRPTTLQDAKNARSRLKALKAAKARANAQAAKARAYHKSRTHHKPQVPPPKDTDIEVILGLNEMMEDEEEDEDEEEEELLLDFIEGDGLGNEFVEVEMGEKATEGGDNYCGDNQTLTQQEQEEIKDQSNNLDPGTRSEAISKIKERLDKTLENCNTQVYMERISFLESLIGDWESGTVSNAQDVDANGCKTRMNELKHTPDANTLPNQERKTITPIAIKTVSQINLVDVGSTLTAKGLGKKTQARHSSDRLVHTNHGRQQAHTTVDINERSNITITELNPSHGNPTQHSKTTEQQLRDIDTCKANERRQFNSMSKGEMDESQQPMVVEIEVEGEVAKVKTVKTEPLDSLDYNLVYVHLDM